MKSILLLMTGGVHWMGGVQYTRNILYALSLLPTSKQPRVILSLGAKNQGKGFEEDFTKYSFLRIQKEPTWSIVLHKAVSRYLGKRASDALGRLTQCFVSDARCCSVAYPVKGHPLPCDLESVLWIPDFQYKVMPENFPKENRDKRDKLYNEMLSSGSMLVLSSQAVADDFARYFPEHADVPVRILRFRSYMNESDYTQDVDAICAQYKLPEKFVYLPNQFFIHKRHDVAFRALAKLKREGLEIPLVCTGSSDDFRTSDYYQSLMAIVKEEGLSEQIKTLGLIPREEQIQIYRRAALVLQPSSFEGWSTSIEDAAALGKTLLMSDIDVHKEQAPAHGHYFACADVSSLAEHLRRVWNDCKPGPDPEREADARLRNREQCLAFADTFMHIMEEAYGRYEARKRHYGN